VVQSQPWTNRSWDPILKNPSQKKGWWSDSSSKSNSGGPKFKPQFKSPKKKKNLNWAGRVAQVVESLPNKHKVLSSNSSTDQKKKILIVPGVMAHTWKPNYLGGGDQDRDSRPAQAKGPQDPISTNKNLGMMACTCHPSYPGSINRRTVVQANTRHKSETSFQK
jgi:hypothetical protein